MALLLSHLSLLPSSSLSPSSSPPPSVPIAAALSSKIQQRSLNLPNGCFHGIRIPSTTHAFAEKRSVIVRASSELDGKEESKPQGSEDAAMPVENLPLESKLKDRMEQKMKLAKKMRLRRKRLLRKRRMRKKGRWPPSKMKKLKNV